MRDAGTVPKQTAENELAKLLEPAATPGHAQSSSSIQNHALEQTGWLHHLRQQRVFLIVVTCVLLTATIVAAVAPWKHRHHQDQEQPWQHPSDAEVAAGLGPAWWPPNPHTSDEANGHFRIGLLMLHVFWYDQARVEFQRAIASDPRYGMGYWGVAMTWKQALWMTEDPQAAQQALQDLQDKADMGALTDQERRYVEAAQALWASEEDMEERERAYSSKMKAMYQSSPDDVDACAFYALSLLSMTANSAGYLSDKEEQQVMSEARQVLADCSARWWDHAGLLHYITHAYDEPDPQVASQGLAAGLHLSEVAPAACHAQHMKSHLFLQLGNWSEVVDSNYRSVVASDRFCNRDYAQNRSTLMACDKDDRYHALEWWMYGLTQQCAFTDSRALLGRMMGVFTYLNVTPFDQWALRMWTHVVMQSHASLELPLPPLESPWPANSALPNLPETVMKLIEVTNVSNPMPTDEDIVWEVHARASALVAAAYAATLHTNTTREHLGGATVEVQVLHAHIQDALAFLQRSVPRVMTQMREQVRVYNLQAQALQVVAACALEGRLDPTCQGWVLKMEQAVAAEESIWGHGPTLQLSPAMELYGHLLLLTCQQPDKARDLFTDCLHKLPHRQSCVLGMARAATLAGDATGASQWYSELWNQCARDAAPPDFLWPGLAEAYFTVISPAVRAEGPRQATGNSSSDGDGANGQGQHVYWYRYGENWVYPAGLEAATYKPQPNTALAASLPAPYPIPADLDPVNRQRLQHQAYRYVSPVLPAPYPGYPGGKVVLTPSNGGGLSGYQYEAVTSAGVKWVRDGYWPPDDNLYTDAARRLKKAQRNQQQGQSQQEGRQLDAPEDQRSNTRGGRNGGIAQLVKRIGGFGKGGSSSDGKDELRRSRRHMRHRRDE